MALAVLTPLLLILGTATLRLACWVSAVKPPGFWHAMLTLVLLIGANIALQSTLQFLGVPPTMATKYLMPTFASALVIAVSLTTGPYSAIVVSVVHTVLTAVLYLGALFAADVLIISQV